MIGNTLNTYPYVLEYHISPFHNYIIISRAVEITIFENSSFSITGFIKLNQLYSRKNVWSEKLLQNIKDKPYKYDSSLIFYLQYRLFSKVCVKILIVVFQNVSITARDSTIDICESS
jgi:hypothetical protein